MIKWTVLTENIMKELLLISSTNIKNVEDRDFPASVQIFIVIYNIQLIENINLDFIGRFLFMGQFRFWHERL
jgi:hypothetical protein